MVDDGTNWSIRTCRTPCATPCFLGNILSCAMDRSLLLGQGRHAEHDEAHMAPAERLTTQQLMTDGAVELAVRMTAQMFGLSQETVTEIAAVGLPLIARTAEVNAEVRSRLYAASLVGPPEPIEIFYVRMTASPPVRQAVMDDYRATYGGMLDAVNRSAGRQAGTTDGQAREVIAALLPAISQVLGRANTGGAVEFAHRLRELGAWAPPARRRP